MAGHFKILPVVDENLYRSAIFASALTDADVGKPVKLVSTDTYDICGAGDGIDGFVASLDSITMGGKVFGSIMVDGVQAVQLKGAVAIGAVVAAAAPSALGTAETNKLAQVSVHTPVATDMVRWRLVSGTGLDGDLTAVVERL